MAAKKKTRKTKSKRINQESSAPASTTYQWASAAEFIRAQPSEMKPADVVAAAAAAGIVTTINNVRQVRYKATHPDGKRQGNRRAQNVAVTPPATHSPPAAAERKMLAMGLPGLPILEAMKPDIDALQAITERLGTTLTAYLVATMPDRVHRG